MSIAPYPSYTIGILRNFAVLEGGDGSGTTTQIEKLKKTFSGKNVLPPLYTTAEPTSGPIGMLIRQILKGRIQAHSETLARLFASDRSEHLYGPGGIVERCGRGELVISDRYSPSSLVYQAIDCDPALPQRLNETFPLPELLIYLDIDSETALTRISGRKEKEIFEALEFQKKVRRGYLDLLPLWEKASVRVVALDGSAGEEVVAEQVWRALAEMPIMKGNDV